MLTRLVSQNPPMGPAVQYATERPDAPYEIRVYPGADARFTIYEDDNETYAYEKGQRATYDLIWDDASSTLTVGARQGSFPGLISERDLRIVRIAGSSSGEGVTIRYSGEPVEARLSKDLPRETAGSATPLATH